MKYKIKVWYTQDLGGVATIEVDAKSEAEAIEKAHKGLYDEIDFRPKWFNKEIYDATDYESIEKS